jgi:hypothetical protein
MANNVLIVQKYMLISGSLMKAGRIRVISILVALASILGILLLYQSRSSIPSTLSVVLSARIYSKPRWYGSGLRDDIENDEDNRERDEPYYHH